MTSRIARATEIKVGNEITECDTPEGPYYVVTKVNAKSVLVDLGDGGMSLRLPIRATDLVRIADA